MKLDDIIEKAEILFFVLIAIGILLLVFYPGEVYGHMGEWLGKNGDYAQSIDQSKLELYTNFEGTSQVTILDTNLSKTHTYCTGSMEPTLGCRSLVLLEILPVNETVGLNDIVSYDSITGVSIMHRIVGHDSEKDCWIFKGDANKNPDTECVKRSKMTARVIGVFYSK